MSQEEKTIEYNISMETERNEAIAFTVFEESDIIVALDSLGLAVSISILRQIDKETLCVQGKK